MLSSNNQDMNDQYKNYTWTGSGIEPFFTTGITSTDFVCITPGTYKISVILHSREGTAEQRSMVYGYISVKNTSGSELYRGYLGSSYYRDNADRHDDTVVCGTTIVYLNRNEKWSVWTERVYSEDGNDDNHADPTRSRLYCHYISAGQPALDGDK